MVKRLIIILLLAGAVGAWSGLALSEAMLENIEAQAKNRDWRPGHGP